MKLVLSVLMIFVIIFAFAKTARMEGHALRIVHMTDPHYISPSITDNGVAFARVVSHGDGKVMLYMEPLIDSFLSEMMNMKPDVLIISGDLTFNGEVKSHQDLAVKLEALQKAGIRIFVLPGNHDISSSQAYRYEGDKVYRIQSPNSKLFYELWHAFGPDSALSCDKSSFSYVAELSPSLRLLMIDVTDGTVAGYIGDEMLAWAKEQLIAAKESGTRVISVSHQTLLRHNALFEQNFRMRNAATLQALLEEYGVLIHLSGHMHIQHILKTNAGLTEITASSLAVQPCQYGVVDIYEGSIHYHTVKTDVAGWAKQQNLTDRNLLTFPGYAASVFVSATLWQLLPLLTKEENANTAVIYAANTNIAYFSGRLKNVKQNNALSIIKKQSTFFGMYFESILLDFGKDFNVLDLAF